MLNEFRWYYDVFYISLLFGYFVIDSPHAIRHFLMITNSIFLCSLCYLVMPPQDLFILSLFSAFNVTLNLKQIISLISFKIKRRALKKCAIFTRDLPFWIQIQPGMYLLRIGSPTFIYLRPYKIILDLNSVSKDLCNSTSNSLWAFSAIINQYSIIITLKRTDDKIREDHQLQRLAAESTFDIGKAKQESLF